MLKDFTLSYVDGETHKYHHEIFESSNEDSARKHVMEVILKDKHVYQAMLMEGKHSYGRVCSTCGKERQIMLVRQPYDFECLDCIKERAFR